MITLSGAKTFMQITSSTYDGLITLYIDMVEAEIEAYVGTHINQTTITDEVLEYQQSNFDMQYRGGQQFDLASPEVRLFLKNYPVSGVTLYDNGSLIDSAGYAVDTSNGVIDMFTFPSDAERQLTANYTAGYATCPSELQLVAYMGVRDLFNENSAASQGSAGVVSKSLGDFSVNYGDTKSTRINNTIAGNVGKSYLVLNKHILDKYKRIDV